MNELVNFQDEMTRHISEIEKTQQMCVMLARTPHYAKMGNEGIFAIVSKARSLNMDPIYALNGGLYYLQGKVGMPAESMSALIREKGHSIVKDPKSNDQICILHGKRADNGDTWISSFSMDDARRAGLVKHSYEKYPAAMLYNRALSFLARQLFSDVIKGAGYSPDELREIAFSNGGSDVTLVEEPETISKDQFQELKEIFEKCEPTYFQQVMSHLKRSSSKVESLENVPVSLYERIKAAALRKREEFLSKMQVEEVVNA